MLSELFEALSIVVQLGNMLFMIAGTIVGVVVGAIPGLSSSVAIAILLPLSYGLSPATAIIFLVAIYVGSMQGGSISAILLNIPGTGAASATALDGYPLSLEGKASEALAAATISSFIGNCLTFIALFFLAPPLAAFSLNFGPAEFFAITVFGITLIGSLAGKNIIKGLISGFIGLLIGTIGVVPFSGTVRYTGGLMGFYDGINLQWGIIGLFAITQALELSKKPGALVKPLQVSHYSLKRVVDTILSMKFMTVLSALIGVVVGIIPGTGATTACWLAYGEAKKRLEPREQRPFGEGRLEGIIASECANNAVVGGSLIPTLVFGIPGSTTTAILLGALVIAGLNPGYDLFQTQAVEAYAVIISIFFAGVIFLIFGLFIIPYSSKIVTLQTAVIAPVVLVLGVTGAFIPTLNVFGIYVTIAIGVIGYILKSHGFSMAPLLLGLILATITERNFHRLLLVSEDVGIWKFLAGRPIAVVIMVFGILSIIGIVREQIRTKK